MKIYILFILFCFSNLVQSQDLTEARSLEMLNRFVCNNFNEFEPYIINDQKELFLAFECDYLGLGIETLYSVNSNCADIVLKIWPADYVFFHSIYSTIIIKECIINENKITLTLQFYLNEVVLQEIKIYEFMID